MVSRRARKPDDKQRRGRERRGDGQLAAERVQDFQLGLQKTGRESYGRLGFTGAH